MLAFQVFSFFVGAAGRIYGPCRVNRPVHRQSFQVFFGKKQQTDNQFQTKTCHSIKKKCATNEIRNHNFCDKFQSSVILLSALRNGENVIRQENSKL